MEAAEGARRDTTDFLAALLRQGCMSRCNPSSLGQRQARGQEVHAAKAACLSGCALAERAARGLAREALPDDEAHAEVMDSAQLALLRANAVDLLHRVRDASSSQCAAVCKRRGEASSACETDCSKGCSHYIGVLKGAL